MLSLRQFAQKIGVSKSVVSRVLNGQPGVATATRERILALAEEYGYTPRAHASSLALATQHVVGWVSPGFHSMMEEALGYALADACQRHRYHWLGHITTVFMRTVEILHDLEACGVDGIIIHSSHYHPLPAELIRRFYARGVPIVAYDMTPAECPVDWVGINELAVGELAVEYLYGLGHRRIAFVGSLSKGRMYGRPRGVDEALTRRGLATDLFIDRDFKDVGRELTPVLQSATPPTAVICEVDGHAIVALSVARHLGISVPAQLSVLGIGDHLFTPYTVPPLTTIALPREDVAKRAVDLLFARIADPSPLQHGRVEQIALPPRLIERGTCAAPPRTR
jgi:LacI family transcriptional regulator